MSDSFTDNEQRGIHARTTSVIVKPFHAVGDPDDMAAEHPQVRGSSAECGPRRNAERMHATDTSYGWYTSLVKDSDTPSEPEGPQPLSSR
ncbi:hypothetical protein [Alicyclobacillus contaminans]|uniref:hypothetical protein n=1 Tax=Alicyclobacillus contaminans TaxID=392016 RepID=UPI0012ECB096|nr:hypothetical protein [Alicyclobacillus contaminans]